MVGYPRSLRTAVYVELTSNFKDSWCGCPLSPTLVYGAAGLANIKTVGMARYSFPPFSFQSGSNM
jgi:hypothetical protein